MSEHFNGLTPEQAEALALLAEECGEVIQIIGKILRHGLYSRHPDGGADNQELLETECGDMEAAVHICRTQGIVHPSHVATARNDKLQRVGRFLHHVKVHP